MKPRIRITWEDFWAGLTLAVIFGSTSAAIAVSIAKILIAN